MKETDSEPTLHWVSAKQLALPTDYKKICECSPEKIERGHTVLEQASNRKLADFYTGMGTGELRSLKAKLFFVAAMVLKQTASHDHKRDMVAKIRKLHAKDPLYPSVATVYRTAAPLKNWLAKKCGLDHSPSVGELRQDPKPLLLLTEENLLDLATKCKTSRKFSEKYRSRRVVKEAAQAPTHKPMAPLEQATSDKPVTMVIRGNLNSAMRRKIAAVLANDCQLLDLDDGQAEIARKWFMPRRDATARKR